MVASTRFSVDRLNRKLSKAIAYASGGAVEGEYRAALEPIRSDIESTIRASGRGGEHNEEFANQDVRVFRALSGRYNILFGWLNPPAHAHERGTSGKLWYQYQDAGFYLFGGSQWIEGVGATIDRRERVLEAVELVNRRYVGKLADILNGR